MAASGLAARALADRPVRIEIAGLVCRLGAITALDGVTLTIAPGTLFGLVGPNGSGKTTLLRAVAGAVAPHAGTVLVAGRASHAVPAPQMARLLAILPQHPVVVAGMTVREAVAWGRHPHLGYLSRPGRADLQVVDEALEQTGTLALADRAMETLSGGERQRALLARALAQTPGVLLLDEPTAHLDIGHQVEVMDLLRALARRGLVVVAALHDLTLASAYCDRMALLSRGRLLAAGAPSDVVQPALIRQAYGARVAVRRHPATGRPYLAAAGNAGDDATGPAVHVICGGGSGAEILARCAEAGCRVSVGVVHVMDTDDAVARELGLRVIEEAPFSPVGAAALAEATAAALAADAVLIAPVPIGPGNLRNLDVAEAALAAGVPVVMVEGMAGRDFTGGAATAAAARLVAGGARVVSDLSAALEALARIAPVTDDPT